MKAILALALFTAVFAIDINSNLWNAHQQQALTQIKQSVWGTWILDFAELHLSTKGALQDLLDNIHQLVNDLEEELETLHANFNRRTGEHNRLVLTLTQQIEDAQREIFNSNDYIDNVLFPQRDRLTATLKQLKENIDANRKALAQETKQRENDHEAFESRAAEHTNAIAAIDECLGLLSQITNPSLAQIKEIQGHLSKIQKNLKHHNVFAPLVRALIELATEQNFADQGAIQQIVTAFNNLRVELVNSLNQETADEKSAQVAFADRVVQLNSEHTEFQRLVLLRTAELTRTNEKLEETQQFLKKRNEDLATLKGQLDSENSAYSQETDVYNGLVTEYTKELDASNKALVLLTQDSFTSYVNSRLGF